MLQQQRFEILPGQQQTTLVIIPSTSTKVKRQKGSHLTCASGTCILTGEENITIGYQLILSSQLHMNLATKVLAYYYDVAAASTL